MSDVEEATAEARRDRMLALTGEPKRDERLNKVAYISRDIVRLEAEKLWPKVWQVACRSEEIPRPGDFVEYQIARQSLIVVRTAQDTIRSFHNVCQHRGRRLVNGSGNTKGFRCGYHGWRYDLNGACAEIADGSDYVSLRKEDVRLKEISVDAWAGWIYVNFDNEAEPLSDYLAPIPQYLDAFELGEMRIAWYRSTVLRANWKTVMDGFIEGYHVPATHPQNRQYFDRRSLSFRHGKHSRQTFAPDSLGFAVPDRTLGISEPEDPRVLLKRYVETRKTELDAIFTDRHRKAAEALMKQVPAGTPANEVMTRFSKNLAELQAKDGAANLNITIDQIYAAGWDWHLFPNHAILPSPDGALCYRFRPNGDDPNRSIMDIWSLIRFTPGEEPTWKHEFYSDWRERDWGRVLTQDFTNFEQVQAGLHSDGITDMLINPLQETAISNYHQVLRDYLVGG